MPPVRDPLQVAHKVDVDYLRIYEQWMQMNLTFMIIFSLVSLNFLIGVVGGKPLIGHPTRSTSLALTLLFAGISLNPAARLAHNHQAASVILTVAGILLLVLGVATFVLQGWLRPVTRK